MQEYQQRVVEELEELQERLTRLTDFINGRVFLTLEEEAQELLVKQYLLMKDLRAVLRARIEYFGRTS